jgi:hypothetical protein
VNDLVGASGWQMTLQYFFCQRVVVFWLLSKRGANKVEICSKWFSGGLRQEKNVKPVFYGIQNRGIRVNNTCG